MAHSKALAGLTGAVIVAAAAFFGVSYEKPQHANEATTTAPSATAKPSSVKSCAVDSLPKEVRPVIASIRSGGPYAYPHNDGVHFGNYENRLPKAKYLEYTVDTPGLNHRGGRRIITGGGSKTNPEHWYYTADHYETFCEVPDA